MQGAVAPLTAGQAVDHPSIVGSNDGLKYIVPTSQTSGMALAAGYLGIFGFFFCPLGLGALVLGVLALRDLRANPYKNGTGRAWTGIVCGAIQLASLVAWLVLARTKH